MDTGWTARGSNSIGREIFRTRPDRAWGPPSLLYNWYRVSFLGVKRPGRGVDHPPQSSVEVKERVELYLYYPSGSSRPVLGWTLHFTLSLLENLRTLPVIIMRKRNYRNQDSEIDRCPRFLSMNVVEFHLMGLNYFPVWEAISNRFSWDWLS
jgi:hypothetical protein